MRSSVCMATYNGSKYLSIQLNSILSQLEDDDEIVIVDDASTDNTCEIINSYQDRRIKLIRNKSNIGVVKTFEKSISNAKGDILFLSDQDDIWQPNKTIRFLEIFQSHPTITLVLSDAKIIDDEDRITANSYFNLRGKFSDSLLMNIIKNKYHGCIMAFRREILDFVLPFPHDIPMHDMWIGIVNSIHGKTFYINESLIQHRRHNENTGRGFKNSANLFAMIKWRFVLIKNLSPLISKNRHK